MGLGQRICRAIACCLLFVIATVALTSLLAYWFLGIIPDHHDLIDVAIVGLIAFAYFLITGK